MHAVVRQIFRRLGSLDAVEEENKITANAADSLEELKMNVQTQGTSTPILSGAVDIVPATPTIDQGRASESHSQAEVQLQGARTPASATSSVRSDCKLRFSELLWSYWLTDLRWTSLNFRASESSG